MKDYRIILEVKGMYCKWCLDHVTKCVRHTSGIISIEPNMKKQKLIITSKKRLDGEKLALEINNLGYGPVVFS